MKLKSARIIDNHAELADQYAAKARSGLLSESEAADCQVKAAEHAAANRRRRGMKEAA